MPASFALSAAPGSLVVGCGGVGWTEVRELVGLRGLGRG